MHKKVMHVITIATEFITKIRIFVSTVRILCALCSVRVLTGGKAAHC